MIFFCRCRSTAFSYWYVVVGAKLADSWWTPFYEWREISLQLRFVFILFFSHEGASTVIMLN
jgi:hypothetical protein